MFKIALIFVVVFVVHVNSHGRLMDPVSRSSAWRVPEFAHLNPPNNWNDDDLSCGGRNQVDHPGTDCGVCGDPIVDPTPRAHEIGGQSYRGIITGRYIAGSIINVTLEITQDHSGFFELRLCANPRSGETQDCFDEYVLARADGTIHAWTIDSGIGWYYDLYLLPAGVTCERCVLQWNYRTGDTWGDCGNGSVAAGCGPQPTYRGCADIIIS